MHSQPEEVDIHLEEVGNLQGEQHNQVAVEHILLVVVGNHLEAENNQADNLQYKIKL